tara:strand:- start:6 stop:230 length:225 start_codon:yes stop_codon:yes gene_type:complete
MNAEDSIYNMFSEIHQDLKYVLDKYNNSKLSKTDNAKLQQIVKQIQDLRIKINKTLEMQRKNKKQQNLRQYFSN